MNWFVTLVPLMESVGFILTNELVCDFSATDGGCGICHDE